MSILVGKETRLIVQGITGRDGSFHARMMKEYGTIVVGGVTPGKGGTSVDGMPVFDSVLEAKENTGCNTSVIFVPARFAVDAIYEAIDAELDLVVCISEGIPTIEMAKMMSYLDGKKTRLIGPNSPGIISPEEAKVGILPGHIFKKGNVGVISRSGTLTYEIVYHITASGYGQSTCIGIGGDQIIGTKFIDALKLFKDDDETEAVVLVGEIGGQDEEETADWIKANFKKPVFGFIAGKTAPPEKRMGHAGAIISGGSGTALEKIKAFQEAGIIVGDTPQEVSLRIREELK
ncbi:MAG TPA: succinate--CoA ligase subunit alpha [bacterium (Candidatus Stahlbacteria)]|nr:succinate--CoA ligase subunit alpha [Candidatus Stahlbacteria bacterium]